MAKLLTLATDGSFAEIQPVSSSAGAADSGKVAQLDGQGRWDISMMPTGIGADTQSIVASEALAAGDIVNIYNNAGTRNCRKAIATDNTKPADGFVLATVANGASATVYMRGLNAAIPIGSFTATDVGKTVFLSASASGGITVTRPTTTGNIVQALGPLVAVGATATINYSQPTSWVTLV